jgi:hypothetical protein
MAGTPTIELEDDPSESAMNIGLIPPPLREFRDGNVGGDTERSPRSRQPESVPKLMWWSLPFRPACGAGGAA